MKHVFISYSRQNLTFAERLARDLDDAGFDVWLDVRQIKGGEAWQEAIFKAINQTETVVVCLSPPAVESKWVRHEIVMARSQEKHIIPVMVEDAFDLMAQTDEIRQLLDVQIINFADRYELALVELLYAMPSETIAFMRAIDGQAIDDVDPDTIPNPFKGLEAFQQTDVRIYFGREDLTAKLLEKLRENRRFVAVVGASGSGKSSLVRAGLIPAIRSGALAGSQDWPLVIFTPGNEPIKAMGIRLMPVVGENLLPNMIAALERGPESLHLITQGLLADAPTTARLVLVVDQFEEVFTRASKATADRFLELLRVAATTPDGQTLVLPTMRADFFDRLSAYPDLAALFEQENMVIATEMTPENLRLSIEGPAAAVGLVYDHGLTDRILEDVREQPGSLPLLQYALKELYERRDGRRLTFEAYEEIGGVRRALAQHAEDTFNEMNAARQVIMQRLLLRLVEVSETGEATRRKVRREHLTFLDISAAAVSEVINQLTAQETRLLIASREINPDEERDAGPTVWIEISHEALIREWKRLANWIVENEESLRYGGELLKAAHDWEQSGRTVDYLVTGARLARAQDWLTNADSSALQREFVEASAREAEIRQQEEHNRLIRESRLERQAANRLRYIVAVLLIAFTGSVGLIVLILDREQQTQSARDEALRSANEAQSLFWLNSAERLRDTNPELALSLALYANSVPNPPGESQSFLANVAYSPGLRFKIQADSIELVGIDGDEIITDECVAESDTEELVCYLRRRNLETKKLLYSEPLETDSTDEFPPKAYGERVSLSPDKGTAVQAVFIDMPFVRADGGTAMGVEIVVWDTKTGERERTIEIPPSRFNEPIEHVRSGSWSFHAHNGDRKEIVLYVNIMHLGDYNWREDIFTINYESGEVTPWNLENDREALNPAVHAIAPSGEYALIYDETSGELVIKSAISGKEHSRVLYDTGSEPVPQVIFSPNSAQLLFQEEDGVSIRDLNGTETSFVENIRLNTTEFLPSHNDAVSLVQGSGALRWSLDGTHIPFSLGDAQPAIDLTVSPDRDLILVEYASGNAQIFRASTHVSVGTASIPRGTLALVSSGRALLLQNGEIAVYEIAPANPVQTVKLPHQLMDYAPTDGLFLVSYEYQAYGSTYPVLSLYDATTQELGAFFGRELLTVSVIETGNGEIPLYTSVLAPDGERILTGAFGHALILIDTETGNKIQSFVGHEDAVSALSFSADGTLAVSGDISGRIILWDVKSGTVLHQLEGSSDSVLTLAFGPNDERIYAGVLNTTGILAWDVDSGDALNPLIHDASVTDIHVMPDGELLLTGTVSGTIYLWNMRLGARLGEYHTEYGSPILKLSTTTEGQFVAVSFLIDSSGIILSLIDNQFSLVEDDLEPWVELIEDSRTDSGNLILVGVAGDHYHYQGFSPEVGSTDEIFLSEGYLMVDHDPESHRSLSLDPSTNTLLLVDYLEYSMMEFTSLEADENESGHETHIFDAAISPNGDRIVTGGADELVYIWNVATTDIVGRLRGHHSRVTDVEYSPDGTVIATYDGQIYLWDTESFSLFGLLEAPPDTYFTTMSFSPDSQILAASATDGNLIFWDINSQEQVRQIYTGNIEINVIAFRDDSEWVATGSDENVIRVWSASSGDLILELVGHSTDVKAIAFVSQTDILVSGSSDGDIFFWDLSTGQAVRRIVDAHDDSVENIWFRDGMIVSASENDYAEWQNHELRELIEWVCQNRYINPLTDEEVRNRYRLGDMVGSCTQ